MAVQSDNIIIMEDGVTRTIEPGVDSLALGVDLELTGTSGLIVGGNLTVNGTTTTIDSQLQTADAFILLNSELTTGSAAAGLVMNVDPLEPNYAITDISSDVITVSTDPSALGVADYILLQDPANANNAGIFEVLSTSTTTITVDTTPINTGIMGTSLTDDTTSQGVVTGVTLTVLRSTTVGVIETAHGSTGAFSYNVLSVGGSVDLQDAYDNSTGGTATITTNSTDGEMIIAGDQKFQITATTGLDVDTIADFDVSSFTIDGASTNTWSAASGSNITMTTAGAGVTSLDSAVALQSSSPGLTADGAFTLQTTGATQLTLGASGGSEVEINSASVDINAGATGVSIGATSGPAELYTSAGDLDIYTLTSGYVDILANADSFWGMNGNATIGDPGHALTVATASGGNSLAGVSPTAAGNAGSLTIVTGSGGASDGTNVGGETGGDGGDGGILAITSGVGRNGQAGTVDPGQPGNGGALNITSGDGGDGAGTSDNGDGGDITLIAGAAGFGGSGTAGTAGVINIGLTNASAINVGTTTVHTNTVGGIQMDERGDPTNAADTGFVYVKDDGGDTELYYMDDGGAVVQITADGGLNVGAITQSLDEAYNDGSAIAVDTGSVVWTGTIATPVMTIAQDLTTTNTGALSLVMGAGLTMTGRPHGLFIDYSLANSFSNASDIFGVFLDGVTNAGAGDTIGISIQSGWDQGIENAASLIQTGAATFSGGVTSSAGEVLVSGGNMQINDDLLLTFGTGDDWSIAYDETTDNALEIIGAASAVTVDGTEFELTGSDGGAASGGASAGIGGDIDITSGGGGASVTGASNTAANAGIGRFLGGIGGAAFASEHDGGNGGFVLVQGGVGGVGATAQTAGTGGGATLRAGNGGAAGGGTEGNGGDASVDAGTGAVGGDVLIGPNFAAEIIIGNSTSETIIPRGIRMTDRTTPSFVADNGFIYVKDDAGDTELYYLDHVGNEIQITADGSLNVGASSVGLDDAYNNGSTITADTGTTQWNSTITTPIVGLNQANTASAEPALLINYTASAFGGRPHGIEIDFSSATSFSNVSDVYGILLQGRTVASTGESVSISIDANWDQGIENASSLIQTGAATFSGGVTSSIGEVLISGGNMQINDDLSLSFGTDDNFTITYDETTDNALEILGATAVGLEDGFGITLTAGPGGTSGGGSTAGTGGPVSISAATGGSNSSVGDGGIGGALSLTAGDGGDNTATDFGGIGGALTITSGSGGAGGVLTSDGGGDAGAFTLQGGTGGAGAGVGGANTAGDGAIISILAGVGGTSNAATASHANAGTGGAIAITAGDGGANTDATAGAEAGHGGDITITAGIGGDATAGASDDGDGGSVTISPGTGVVVGTVIIDNNTTETGLVVNLINSTKSDGAGLFTGTSTPSGTVTGTAGSLFLRDADGSSGLYVNTSTGSGTDWTQLAASGGSSLQTSYEAGEAIIVDSTNGTLSIAGTVDDAQTVMTMTGGVHTGAQAENMLLLTSDDQSTGYAMTINNIGSGDALDVQDNGTSVLTASGAGQVSLTPTSGEDATITTAGAGNVDVNLSTGNFTVDTADGGSFSLDSTGAPSNISLASTADTDDLTISVTGANNASLVLSSTGTGTDAISITTTVGGMDITTAADSVWTVDAASATALIIDDGTSSFITIDTSATTVDQVLIDQFLSMGSTAGFVGTTDGTGVTINQVVALTTAGTVQRADADSVTSGAQLPIGVAANTAGAASSVAITTVTGSLVTVTFDSAPGAATNGSVCYLDDGTVGAASLTAPSVTGSTVFRLGIVQGADGTLTDVPIVWMPQFVAEIP